MKSISLFARNSINYGVTPCLKATAVFPNGYISDSTHKQVTLPLVGNIPQNEYGSDYVNKWGYISDFTEGSPKYSAGTSDNGKFTVGGTVISEFSFSLNNYNDKFTGLDFRGAYLQVSVGAVKVAYQNYLATEASTGDNDMEHVIATESGDAMSAEYDRINTSLGVEWHYLGTFYFVEHKAVGKVINCTTYDLMKFFDEYMILADDNISFPCKAGELVRTICNNRGIPLANSEFDGYDTVLQVAPQQDITERQALAYVCQITGNYARMGVLPSTSLDRLIIDWYDTSSTLTSDRRFSHSIETNDVVITGVTVNASNTKSTTTDGQKPSYTYPVGADSASGKYLVVLENNPWIVDTDEETGLKSNLEEVAKKVASKVVGLTLCPGSESIFTDLSIEPGDVLRVKTDNGDGYVNFIVTNLSMSLGTTETITCDAEAADQTDLRQTAITSAIDFAKTEVGKKLTAYQTMANMFARLAKESLGLYEITKTGDDGSTIAYYASAPTLEEVNHGIVWTITRSAIQCCEDYVYGDDEWNAAHLSAGVTVDGMALLQTLTAVGINADWIQAGALQITDTDNNETFYADTKTGTVRIRANSFSLQGKTIQDYSDEAKKDANKYTDDAVSNYDLNLNQDKVFDRLTNGDKNQGIYLEGSKLYINAEYLATGVIRGHKKGDKSTVLNYWNLDTGEFHLAASTTVGDNNKTIDAIAKDASSAAVDGQTQRDIFNKLTNNGTVQGITLTSDGKLYINATYVNTGIITDKTGNNSWNLDTGEFQISAGTKVGDSSVATQKQLEESNNGSIKSVSVEYAVNNDSKTAPTSGWTTDKTVWTKGKYIWQRTVTKNGHGESSTSAASCIGGNGISSITDEYYLSTSQSTQTGGSWVTTQPAWSKGKYIWTRSKISWTDGTTTTTDPVLAKAINSANELADSVNSQLKVTNDSISAEVQSRRYATYKNLFIISAVNDFITLFDSYSLDRFTINYQHGAPTYTASGYAQYWCVDIDTYAIYFYRNSSWTNVATGANIQNALFSITDEVETITIQRGNSGGDKPTVSANNDSVYIDTSSYQGVARNDVYQRVGGKWIKISDSSTEYKTRFEVTEDSINAEVTSREQNAYASNMLAAVNTLKEEVQATTYNFIDAYFQDSQPNSRYDHDLWMDTDDGNRVYSYYTKSSSWNERKLKPLIAALLAAAQNARMMTYSGRPTGRISIYVQTTQPSGRTGSLWIKNETYVDTLYQYLNGSWQEITCDTQALSTQVQVNARGLVSKVSSGDVESIIEQNASSIRMKAQAIEWQANYSSMDANGQLTCTGFHAKDDTSHRVDIGANYLWVYDSNVGDFTDSNGNLQHKQGIQLNDGEAGIYCIGSTVWNAGNVVTFNAFSAIGGAASDKPVMWGQDAGGHAFAYQYSDTYFECTNFSVRNSSSKNMTVKTDDYGERTLSCLEYPTQMFGDVGEATIGEDGLVYVQIDPIFLECINTNGYTVFLQNNGEGTSYIKERTSNYFVIAGTPGLSVSWDLKAQHWNHNSDRLPEFNAEIAMKSPTNDVNYEAEGTSQVNKTTDYGASAAEHINNLQEEMTA